MSRQHEINLNNTLAELLDGMFSQAQVQSENTDVLAGKPSKRPDIRITGKGAPVVLEAEFDPANNVEEDAKERFQTPRLKNESRPLEAVIALIYPQELRTQTKIKAALAQTRLRYCVFSANKERFPKTGWLEGSVCDLADLIDLIAVPRIAFDKKRKLKNTQTRRIAGAILANALIFHERIAGVYPNILPINQICGRSVDNPKQAILDAWEKILAINYWPIFAIGKDILRQLPSTTAATILRLLTNVSRAYSRKNCGRFGLKSLGDS